MRLRLAQYVGQIKSALSIECAEMRSFMSKPIGEIRADFEAASIDERKELYLLYENDERKGVINLIAKYRREEEKLKAELCRLNVMKQFEIKYSEFQLIAGIDEAGRGPLAGPVVAGAVILPKDCTILYLNDSKKLSAAKRDLLYDEIKNKAVAYGIGMASPERIDEINILQATFEAMHDAIDNMNKNPDMVLVDAVNIPHLSCKQVGIIKGDEKSVSIAAASIMAKVTRDRIMEDMDKLYPEYGFSEHKGYGTKAHIETLKKYGACPIHRNTFIKKFV